MNKKKLLVMTSFGPVPFEAVENHLSKDVVEKVNSLNLDGISEVINSPVPMCVGYYIGSLANKVGWKPEKMAGYLDNLSNINYSSVFSILLREVAIELDKQYKDHINNCEELFVISLMDGRIHKVPRKHIKNFRNFAAFRTEQDAKIACRILRNELKHMFKEAKSYGE